MAKPDRRKTLDRLLRVRTLQLGLASAEETRAHTKVATETALKQRIAELVDAVSPVPATDGALSLRAAAHFREKLHGSAQAAEGRVRTAQHQLGHAEEATRSARRDQSVIEKLLERAKVEAVRREMRALEDLPPSGRKRHDPC